ncbi:glycosyltransferase family 9 protein [Tunturiibacter lichenicola]|uniref:glycosyltransferase family 9 protein n=1 Tax=Tunturiibacter lichenicola TaxID=2051959 RepID=UPI0021B27AD9|nr:glycosyltransferase family 9 protein [Edaphobacter lichenicola]
MATTTKRVLIYRLGSLGDTLIALPALHLVARVFPNAERRMLTNFPVNVKAPPAAAILENSKLVHGYFRYSAGTRSPRELLSLWWQLLRWRPQVLVYMGAARGVESARRDAKFFRLCGISHLIGIPVTEDMQQNRLQEFGQFLEPEGARLVRNLVELGGIDLDAPASWDLLLTDKEHSRATEVLVPAASKPIIAVSVGTKVQSKDWGRDNWRALLHQIARLYPNHALALCGAGEENEASEFAADGWRENSSDPVINLCGRLTPRESAAVFAQARLFIGHDSGPMHLAAAVQTPCVAIFAARNKPRVWFPYGKQHRVLYHQTDCWGCGLETCIVERKKCLTSITVEEVMAQVRNVLG